MDNFDYHHDIISNAQLLSESTKLFGGIAATAKAARWGGIAAKLEEPSIMQPFKSSALTGFGASGIAAAKILQDNFTGATGIIAAASSLPKNPLGASSLVSATAEIHGLASAYSAMNDSGINSIRDAIRPAMSGIAASGIAEAVTSAFTAQASARSDIMSMVSSAFAQQEATISATSSLVSASVSNIANGISANSVIPQIGSMLEELQSKQNFSAVSEALQNIFQSYQDNFKLASLDIEFKAAKNRSSVPRYLPEHANYQARLQFHWNDFIKNTHAEFDELFSDDKRKTKWFHILINKADDLFHGKNVKYQTIAEVIFALFLLSSFISAWMQLGYLPGINDVLATSIDTIIDYLNDFRKSLLNLVLIYGYYQWKK